MQPRTHGLGSRNRVCTMILLGAIVACIAPADGVRADEQSAVSLEAELPQLIAACNRFVEGGRAKRRAMGACNEVAKAKLYYLLDPAASSAYQQYRAYVKHWQTCERMQAPVPFRQRLSCPR